MLFRAASALGPGAGKSAYLLRAVNHFGTAQDTSLDERPIG